MSSRLAAALPTDVVRELEANGMAVRLPVVRAGSPIDLDVVVVGMQVATTLVTFAQIPQTLNYLAARLCVWRRAAVVDSVKMDLRGPNGRIQLDLSPDVEASDIASMLRLLSLPEAL